jgi:superfamily II DNA or RNA helicase
VAPSGDSSALEAGRRLEHARATFAEVAERDVTVAGLGAIVLRPDQIETARRVLIHLHRDGGCMLADDVGSGKTYVALFVARHWARPLVVAPASLRTTWDRAARRAGVDVHFASHESLSRGRLPDESFDGIIVDESHRFRATSRRHFELARLASHVPLLMLSATPVQNHGRELAAQVALFLGEVAFRIEPEALTRWVVRSPAPVDVALPLVAPPRWIALDVDDGAVLRDILALPPPPRTVDAGDGGVLLQLSLVRAWTSSRAALVASIRRRCRTLAAIEQCHAEGRLPTRRELRSWHCGDDVQLGFPTLLANAVVGDGCADALAAAIDDERDALDALMRTLDRGDDPDLARVSALRALRVSHQGASILAFSEWASTVRAYWSALRADARVGLLTANEGRIASGRIARDALLARFAPRAQGAPDPPARERVTLLLTTDLLSEGVNLQDASVVVHLDLPWNPARLAQRLGRIRRPGGADRIASYLMSPPARASLLLRTESRLRAKLRRAERAIGRGPAVLPMLTAPGAGDDGDASHAQGTEERESPLSAAELRGEIARRLARWRRATTGSGEAHDDRIAVAAAEAEASGWIALLGDGRLVALNRARGESAVPSEAADEIVRALASSSGSPRFAPSGERDAALGALEAWLALEWTHRSCGLATADSPLRRRVLRALDRALQEAPRHRRSSMLECAARVRQALVAPLPLGLERSLGALVQPSVARHDWIEDAATLVTRAPVRSGESATSERAMLRALILFGPGSGAAGSNGANMGECDE